MASPLLPTRFWGLDDLLESFPKFYIHDLLEMPEIESHSGIFQYRDHPVSTVDILGVIVKIHKRDEIIIYAVDDGTGVISCSCFKSISSLQEKDISKLKEQLKGGPLESKVEQVLLEIEQDSNGYCIGQLLHVRGALQTYENIRQIKADDYAVVLCPLAETERMLLLPQLYRTIYDKPFVLPDRLTREASSLPAGEMGRQNLSRELQLQEELTKLVLADLDEKEPQLISEHDLLESVKRAAEAAVNEPLIWKRTLTRLVAVGHLCRRHMSHEGEYVVIRYNQQLRRSVIGIISKHMEDHSVLDSNDPGCHFTQIYEELRKLLPFSMLNKPALWRCLALLEEQGDIISSSEKHFVAFGRHLSTANVVVGPATS